MPMPIQLLPPQLANQIAAGEVVERPASVVKELVENSLDAGATDIRIDIEKGGARRIRVRDNGCGIPKDELTLALSRHATSKIASLDDLEAILSLGFRGEALASISSVSRLRLTSRPQDNDEAWAAFCEGRDMAVALEPASHPVGSTVDVEDLFFNTPARRKFLRTEKTEFNHIDEVVRRIALARPDVTVVLSHNQQVLRQYHRMKDENHSGRLQQVAGRRFAEEAIYLDHHEEALSLRGWFSPPQACRHQNDIQYMYVNGRMMRDKLLNHAVRQAYGEALPDDRQPTFILYLNLPAHDVDVNVHPAKHEVRFHQARQVHDFVLGVLRNGIAQVLGTEGTESTGHSYQHGYGPQPDAVPHVTETMVKSEPRSQQRYSDPHSHVATPSPFFPMRRSTQPGTSQQRPAPPSASALDAQSAYQGMWPTSAESNSVEHWRFIAIHADWFALLQADTRLGLLDSRRLQRQLLQQRLQAGLEVGLTGQPLLLPVALTDRTTVELLLEKQILLQELGILLRRSGRQSVQIEQVSSVLRHGNISEIVPALAAWLSERSLTCLRDMTEQQRTDLAAWLGKHAVLQAPSKVTFERLLREADDAKFDWRREIIELPWHDAIRDSGVSNESR